MKVSKNLNNQVNQYIATPDLIK